MPDLFEAQGAHLSVVLLPSGEVCHTRLLVRGTPLVGFQRQDAREAGHNASRVAGTVRRPPGLGGGLDDSAPWTNRLVFVCFDERVEERSVTRDSSSGNLGVVRREK